MLQASFSSHPPLTPIDTVGDSRLILGRTLFESWMLSIFFASTPARQVVTDELLQNTSMYHGQTRTCHRSITHTHTHTHRHSCLSTAISQSTGRNCVISGVTWMCFPPRQCCRRVSGKHTESQAERPTDRQTDGRAGGGEAI